MGVVCYQQNNYKRKKDLNNTKDITSSYSKNNPSSIIKKNPNDYSNNSNILNKIINKEEKKYDNINENNINENNINEKNINKNNINENNITDIALKKHNELRKIYEVEPLNLNNELCELAQKYAEECAETESLDHIPYFYKGSIIGENIIETNNENLNIPDIIQKWFGEQYHLQDDNQNHKFNNKASHFCQIIWKDTKEVGFGLSQSQNKKAYFVAFYFPAGNIFDKFKENLK